MNGHFLIRVADTVTPVEPDKEEDAFSRKMLDACSKQLRAKMEKHVDGHRTEVTVTLPVND